MNDIQMVKFLDNCPTPQLIGMKDAARQILDCYRMLTGAGTSVVTQCLEQQCRFSAPVNYPDRDIREGETLSQYSYHSHKTDLKEHGHFHTFLRANSIPADCRPMPCSAASGKTPPEEVVAHFVSISMTRDGFPKALFTLDRWSAGQACFSARDTLKMLDRFEIDHTSPCLAVNLWITAMFHLFRPQIEWLLHERDRKMATLPDQHPGNVYEHADLNVASFARIDVSKQLAEVNSALARRNIAA